MSIFPSLDHCSSGLSLFNCNNGISIQLGSLVSHIIKELLSSVGNGNWEVLAGNPSWNLLAVVSLGEKVMIYTCCAQRIISKAYWSVFAHTIKARMILSCLWIYRRRVGIYGKKIVKERCVKLPGMLCRKLNMCLTKTWLWLI